MPPKTTPASDDTAAAGSSDRFDSLERRIATLEVLPERITNLETTIAKQGAALDQMNVLLTGLAATLGAGSAAGTAASSIPPSPAPRSSTPASTARPTDLSKMIAHMEPLPKHCIGVPAMLYADGLSRYLQACGLPPEQWCPAAATYVSADKIAPRILAECKIWPDFLTTLRQYLCSDADIMQFGRDTLRADHTSVQKATNSLATLDTLAKTLGIADADLCDFHSKMQLLAILDDETFTRVLPFVRLADPFDVFRQQALQTEVTSSAPRKSEFNSLHAATPRSSRQKSLALHHVALPDLPETDWPEAIDDD